MRSVCWVPTWNAPHAGVGLEHVWFGNGEANSVLLAIDEHGVSFRLRYQLSWNAQHVLRSAHLVLERGAETRALSLTVDDAGRWRDASGDVLAVLDGCVDIDIWPTPFTNSFPIWRSALAIGERRAYRMAWVSALEMTVETKAQAYTRLADRTYLFESLDGSGFAARLEVDADGLVLDYPELFRRVMLR